MHPGSKNSIIIDSPEDTQENAEAVFDAIVERQKNK